MLPERSRFVCRLSCIVVAVVALLFLMECNQPTSSTTPKPSDVTNVGTVNPSDLVLSGANAANVPSSLVALKNALEAIPSTDPLVSDVVTSFDNPAGSSQLDNLITALKNFPNTKSLNETVSLSGNTFGTYVKLTTATSTFTATAVTSDGGPLQDPSKLSSANGQVVLSLVLDPQNLPAGSAIKDFKFRLNAGGTVSYAQPNITFDYGESLVLAFSFNLGDAGKTGGKVVVTANAKNQGTANITASSPTSFASTMTVSLSIYDDGGNVTFTKTWTDPTALASDLSSL